MAQGKSEKKPANRGGMAFGRNVMVLGAAIFGLGVYGTFKGAMTLSWPRAPATITSADLLRQSSPSTRPDGSTGVESWNSFHVLYRYRVGGQEYVAGGVEPYDFGMQNSAGAEKMKQRHPVGSAAQVAYDPGNPAVAYLEPGPSSFALMLAGIGSTMSLIGYWVRRKASQGIGTMNDEGATERIARASRDGESV